MKFGINTLLWTADFGTRDLGMLADFRSHGFDGIEIARFSFDGFPAAEIRRAIENQGLEATFCSALIGELSLCSEDAGVRRRAREFLLAGIQTAAELGARSMIGPFCAPVGYLPGRRRTDDEWKWCVDGLRQIAPALAEYDVTLAVEPLNRFETYFLNTVDDAVKLCGEVGDVRVGILFDTFHANIEEKAPADALLRCGRHLKHVHSCENDRGTPGSGHVDWDGVFRALKQINYDEWIVIESFGSRIEEIAAAACIWRDLAPSAESIAYEGLAFLKGKGSPV